MEHVDLISGISEPAVQALLRYSFVALALGALLLGDVFILAAAFLAGRDLFSIAEVLLFSSIGALGADLFWFAVGRRQRHKIAALRMYQNVLPLLHRLTRNNLVLELMLTKYMYGVRLLLLMHMAQHTMSIVRFVLYDIPAIALWLFFLISVGWLAGQGFNSIVPTYQKVSYVVCLSVVLLLTMYFFKKKISATYKKKQ